MLPRRLILFNAFLLALTACSDLSTAPGPVPQLQPPGLSLDVDPPTAWPVRINSVVAAANVPRGNLPPGTFGNVIGSMNYDAHHAKIWAFATLHEGESVTLRTFIPQERHAPGFLNQSMRAEWQIAVRSQCGALLEADIGYEAWWRGFGGGGMELILDKDTEGRQASDDQPECECDEDTELQNNEFDSGYDPYSDGGGDCGATPGEEEGGEQFEVGDFTGGQTVDWNTGIGNGGVSECGQAAQVDFVCIDMYNETTQEWETWDCGYVTTC